jgi:hypothetical protein
MFERFEFGLVWKAGRIQFSRDRRDGEALLVAEESWPLDPPLFANTPWLIVFGAI